MQRSKPNCRADKDDGSNEEGRPKLALSGCIALWPDSEREGQNCDIEQEGEDADRKPKPVTPTAMQHFVAVGVGSAASHGLSAQRGPGKIDRDGEGAENCQAQKHQQARGEFALLLFTSIAH